MKKYGNFWLVMSLIVALIVVHEYADETVGHIAGAYLTFVVGFAVGEIIATVTFAFAKWWRRGK